MLDPAVNHNNILFLVFLYYWFFRRDLLNKIYLCILLFKRLLWIFYLSICRYYAHHRSVISDFFCKHSGVYSRYSWNALILEPFIQVEFSIPLAAVRKF